MSDSESESVSCSHSLHSARKYYQRSNLQLLIVLRTRLCTVIIIRNTPYYCNSYMQYNCNSCYQDALDQGGPYSITFSIPSAKRRQLAIYTVYIWHLLQ